MAARRLGGVMTYAQHLVSLRTYGLALALVFSPALMQVGDVGCEPADPTTLADLQFKPFQMPGQVLPEDMIAFEPGVMVYEVDLPDSVTQAMVVAEPAVESSEVTVQCVAGGTITGHPIDPALDWIPIDLPEGESVLEIIVHASPDQGSGFGEYTIVITRSEPADPTALADLQFRPFQMPGQELPEDMIAFEPGVMVYEVELPDSVTEAMVVAEPAARSSEVTVQCIAGGIITGHPIDPALDWIPIELPEGDSVLEVIVHASTEYGSEFGEYQIYVTRAL